MQYQYTCHQCNKKFTTSRSNTPKFCSVQCFRLNQKANLLSFWNRIDSSKGKDSCWEWKLGKSKAGYGMYWHDGKMKYAHIYAYQSVHGIIPDGKLIRHKCDNPPCCNPSHLLLGTHTSNMKDMRDRQRGHLGIKSKQAKLTNKDVLNIRTEYAKGNISQTKLGIMYGVTSSVICEIVNRKAWNHI